MPNITRIATAAAIVALVPSTAHAYIDPATGTILVQGLIAAVAGGLAFVKIKWAWIKSRFGGSRQSKEKDSEAPGEDEQPPA